MSKWLRILLGLGIAAVACGAYLWLFGVQTFFIWETRSAARKEPALWATPTQLLDLSTSQAQGKSLSYFGYQFEVPWDDIDQEQSKVIGTNKAIIVFRSGNVISFWSGPPDELISTLQGTGKIDRKSLSQLFGDKAVRSDYALKRAILDTTPAKFSLLTPKRLAIQQGMFFTMKAATLPAGADSYIFSFGTREFEGFQYGSPQTHPKYLSVELFNSDGHLDVFFGQKLDEATAISQADVNRVVQTIHKSSAK
jgi:hypothetical protein